jgi:hypothetical protein
MRRDELVSPDDLMRPDLLSEIVLIGTGIAVLLALIMVIVAVVASAALRRMS